MAMEKDRGEEGGKEKDQREKEAGRRRSGE